MKKEVKIGVGGNDLLVKKEKTQLEKQEYSRTDIYKNPKAVLCQRSGIQRERVCPSNIVLNYGWEDQQRLNGMKRFSSILSFSNRIFFQFLL